MKQTLINIFLLLFIYSDVSIFSQWTPDAYINDFKVNDDGLNSYQIGSNIGVDTSGNFIIAWTDSRIIPGSQYPWQVYCQRFNKDGLALGSNFRIGHDTAGFGGITVLPDGRFVVLWVRDFRANGGLQYYEMFFQRFNKNGVSIGPPTSVLDTAFLVEINVLLSGISISSDPNGKFIVCWSKGHTINSFPKVYFQRYDSTGTRIGLPDSVNEANSRAEYPDITMNYNGSFEISWRDNRFAAPGKYDIFMQRYAFNGLKIGNNIKVNDDSDPNTDQVGAKISSDGNGNFALVWIDSRSSQTGMFYQLYDSNGNTIGVNRKADVLTAFGLAGAPRISMRNDNYFFIGWLDFRYSGKDQYYGRRFNALGNPIGNAYMIPESSPGNSSQNPDDIYVLGDRVYATWTDNRNGGSVNYDIYCNVRGFQNPDTVLAVINTNELIKQNNNINVYPNPFNSSAVISYRLEISAIATLKIYDIKGSEVVTLVNEFKRNGNYSIKWNAGNFSSGIYFARLIIDSKEIIIQKIIFIK